MASKSERRRKMQAKKKAEKAARMKQPGMRSKYALKQREPVGDRLRRREAKRREERAAGDYGKMVRHRMVPEGEVQVGETEAGHPIRRRFQPAPPEPRVSALDRWRLALYGEGALERMALWGRP